MGWFMRKAVFPKRNDCPCTPGFFDDDQVGHRAEDRQIASQGAGHGQGQPSINTDWRETQA